MEFTIEYICLNSAGQICEQKTVRAKNVKSEEHAKRGLKAKLENKYGECNLKIKSITANPEGDFMDHWQKMFNI